ncbi:hypothetical protein [Pseudobacteriovorax antillogorgiicola]|uniref:Uncharacterized protein n=1 Tax=Pseudobacteriovorax antillogorgiicola TaxID=1513793 RepID=A0A1Y6B6U1_9BACT|nr:hypothetical protein [Pseudobacteriovorax antillogorgiicola]TCS59561.1 hypothetical protein EDD56_101481 [Pseudobacteriovorax antillogorgiicola]SME87713.1 hypothetical protein SAMN06296036_1014 [Pseudobacteriovorax antillogorgiicola]
MSSICFAKGQAVPVDSKEAFLSAKILVDFIRDFTFLSEQQLMAIRKLMESTVQDIMSSVNHISSTADDKIEKASRVLVKDDQSDDFMNASMEEADTKATKTSESAYEQRRIALENKLRRSGGVFSKHMEALSTMDTDVQDLLVKVVGSVSMDDVMAQRLSHVTQSIHLLRAGLSKVVNDHRVFSTQSSVKQLRNEILTEVYRSYTAEEEKQIFHKIFGQPKVSNKKVS